MHSHDAIAKNTEVPDHLALPHPQENSLPGLVKVRVRGSPFRLCASSLHCPTPSCQSLSPLPSHLSLCRLSRALGATLSVCTSSVLLRDRPAVPFTFTVFGTSTSPSTRASSIFLKLKFPPSVGSVGRKRQKELSRGAPLERTLG